LVFEQVEVQVGLLFRLWWKRMMMVAGVEHKLFLLMQKAYSSKEYCHRVLKEKKE